MTFQLIEVSEIRRPKIILNKICLDFLFYCVGLIVICEFILDKSSLNERD